MAKLKTQEPLNTRLLSNLVLLFALGVAIWALSESDVGVVDWNKHYIGVPLVGSVTTAPAFHHVGNKTIILTATGSNVFGCFGTGGWPVRSVDPKWKLLTISFCSSLEISFRSGG